MSRAPIEERAHPRTLALGFAVGLAALAGLAGCETTPGDSSTRTYVERLGTDTVSVEAYRRTDTGFEGQLIVRSPVTRVVRYRASFGPDGTVDSMTVEWTTPAENPDGPEPTTITYVREADTVTVERIGGRSPGTSRVEAPADAIPMTGTVPLSYAVTEQVVRQALSQGRDSAGVSFVSAGGRVVPNAVARVDSNTVSLDFFGSPILIDVGTDGRILGRSGARTTLKVEGVPAAGSVDVAALASSFAARDARGEGFGVASPQATVEASVDGANLTVVYSRPAKRGREIWGDLVQHGEVWRTGANAATAFSTDRALEIGGVEVPAGDYTLYSIYTANTARLIINQQTGQWGTVYDPDQDLARIDMTRNPMEETAERFTISIEDTADGGELRLVWDQTAFSVPFRVL